ncbi:hypothetical protein [Hyunsoonleella pacifica]|uniref:Outer membrane protein beta-barrel domain-containing protein n=1 Tax=Hyunsoonleella pacifica TaxID=1080224 RepID=A0A4Q9FJN6_9FLAO|nr:hypothetical protein [Hyunsoonleella pacifica]TBN13178.1 hypothetical protein EYD46_16925 [Hyunsoonleella pacifica]GGD28822.1 hypothetical protein GCM10011368_33510 [Hyunsoonleella pacifica]
MKKLFVLAVALLGFTFTSNAQEIADNAIGLRLGDSDGFGAEISYQRALSENNRLELDLGLRSGNNFDGFKLAGLYQWVWLLDGNFNWYAGVGGGLASYSFDRVPQGFDDGDTFVFAAGNIGIEYNFDIPLQLSLDFRPEIGFGNDVFDNDDLDFDIALGIRYQF